MSGRGVLRIIEGGQLGFWCPGCECMHAVDSGWTFDGNYDKPTFSPSILVTYRHPKGHTNENPAPFGYQGEYVEDRCHSFVKAGQIEFLGDCTHALVGKTVPLEPMP
jgi:uncharacterized protein DUF6527